MIYVQLFLSFLQVGMFSVGGGYAAIPLIQSQVVEQHGWLTMQEFTDLVTIAEMTPGPIAVNAATFVGLRIAQVSGAIVATLGCITPALFFVSLLSYIYRRYKDISLLQSVLACLRPVIVALIFGAGLSILSMVAFGGDAKTLAHLDWVGIGSFAAAFSDALVRKRIPSVMPSTRHFLTCSRFLLPRRISMIRSITSQALISPSWISCFAFSLPRRFLYFLVASSN